MLNKFALNVRDINMAQRNVEWLYLLTLAKV